jgi:aryl-alcohol dehydrogenase-like predicted oxidoreductase
MKEAVDLGYTTFDLADVYGEAEAFVGRFHAEHGFPEGVMFNTKWIPTGYMYVCICMYMVYMLSS